MTVVNDRYKLQDQTNSFLKVSSCMLTHQEFILLADIIAEWNLSPSITDIIAHWQSRKRAQPQNAQTNWQIISFNVRGLDPRWDEVCLLMRSHHADIMVLIEVGHFDLTLVEASFSNHQVFYQKGENSHGGVLTLVRKGISTDRIKCKIPNVCVVDLN